MRMSAPTEPASLSRFCSVLWCLVWCACSCPSVLVYVYYNQLSLAVVWGCASVSTFVAGRRSYPVEIDANQGFDRDLGSRFVVEHAVVAHQEFQRPHLR